MLTVCILAGGLATRLRPITEKIPKALVDVAGEPFIVRQLRYLRAQGISKVVLCVGYLSEMIEAVIGDGKDFGIDVVYSSDGPNLLGTGGAIKKALPLLGQEFFLLYGDSFLPIEFGPVEAAYLASGKAGLMTVLRNGDQWDKSNVLFEDGRLIEYNKRSPSSAMRHIDYGLGILNAQVFEGCEEDQTFDLADIYHDLSVGGRLAGYEVYERFYEIGSHSGLREAEEYFKGKERS
jgi:N-acetyl-alpha-D-muramate 1-phosphate uridylyltransferase